MNTNFMENNRYKEIPIINDEVIVNKKRKNNEINIINNNIE